MTLHVEHQPLEIDSILLRALPEAGVYSVGGRVRDELLLQYGTGVPVNVLDLDYLVTGASLSAILERLSPIGRAEVVGASFGVIKFTVDGITVDVALPRRERSTGTHHRDFAVEAAPDIPIADDLARRDFRMNMMARDLRTQEILDPYGGRDDLRMRRLDVLHERAFVEDPLRTLRGAQFAARFSLTPTERTLRGMRDAADLIPTVAQQRMADELTKLLVRSERPSIGFEILREVSALHHVLPELMEGWNVEQNEFHKYTVYEHSLKCCDAAPNDLVLRLAALLHDVGKPRTKEGPHFYRHEAVGEEMARAALERLRFPKDIVERVCALVAHHMYVADPALSDAAIRRFIRRVTPERIDDMFALRHADVVASGLPPRGEEEQTAFEERVRAELTAKRPFGVHDLAIDGEMVMDVMRRQGLTPHGFRGDARVGAALRHCLEIVLEDPAANEESTLVSAVRDYFAQGAPKAGTA